MFISQRGIDLIKAFGYCQLTAYLCPAGVWTIGYGICGYHVREGLVISEETALDYLHRDIRRFEKGVRMVAGPCTQGQFDALVCHAFDNGVPKLVKSRLLQKHLAGDHQGAASEFYRGAQSDEMCRRRMAERQLYLS